MRPLSPQLATSDPPPHYWLISVSCVAVGSLTELTVYLETKVHEQIRKPDNLSSTAPVPCPAPAASSGAIPVTSLSQEGLACGGGEETGPGVTLQPAGSRWEQSSAPGSLRTVHLPAAPGPPWIPDREAIRYKRTLEVIQDNPNQITNVRAVTHTF